MNFTEFVLIGRNFSLCICIFSTIIIEINRFDTIKQYISYIPCVLNVIYRPPFLIYILSAGYLFQFPCYLQAFFLNLHVVYSLLFWFTCYWQCFGNLICYVRVSRLNHKKFTSHLPFLQEQFTCHMIYIFFTWNLKTWKRVKTIQIVL